MGQEARDLDNSRSIGSHVFESELPVLDKVSYPLFDLKGSVRMSLDSVLHLIII